MFGEEFVKNIMLCFTHFGQDLKSQRQRRAQGISQESIIKDYKTQFKSLFKQQLS